MRHVTKYLHYQTTRRLSQLLKVAAMQILLLLLTTVTRGQSALDGFDPKPNGAVHVVVVQSDGRILLGGNFTTLSPNGGATVTRNRIARLNPDGTLDTAFDPNANGEVSIVVFQADGKILLGGGFTTLSPNGGAAVTRNRIARLDATTGLVDSFNPNQNGAIIYAIAVQADGKVVVGGLFDRIGGQFRNNIARLDAATGLADSFNAGASTTVVSIAVQADGKILVGGGFSTIGGQPRSRIARLDPTTGLADSFDPNANFDVRSIAVQADGRILAGGWFTGPNSIGGQTRNYIARLDPTTGLADSFDPNANDFVDSIVVQADGKILVGGEFSGANSIGGQSRNYMARLDATTGLADSFNPNVIQGAANLVDSIAVQADGKILLGGVFLSVGGQPRQVIARVETDGRLDQTLNPDVGTITGFHKVNATAVQPDGKILIGGDFTSVLGVTRNYIARLNTDGTLDIAFNPNASDTVFSIVVQPDGKILAGGDFGSIGGQPRSSIARLDATTGLPDSFNPSANGEVVVILIQADGKILVGGNFQGTNSIGGQTRNYIARLDPTTGLADSFNPNANADVDTFAVQADGKILTGGGFSSIGGQQRSGIARLDPGTGLADSYNPNANDTIFSIAVQADGKILAGGFFTSIGGQTRNHIARLDGTTGLADSFDPNANNFVYSIVAQADTKILACGLFTSIGGQPRNYITRLDPMTGVADLFDPNPNDVVRSVALQTDGKILAGGYFTSIGGQTRNRFARLTNDTAALQNLSATQNAVTWTHGGSSPQFTRVTFEYSTDNVNYTLLGNGMAVGSDWTLTGLSIPAGVNLYIRARGYCRSGYLTGSESMSESVRNVFLAGLGGTPTPSPTPTSTPMPTPSATATPIVTPTPTPTATPTMTPTVTPGTLGNISTRVRVLSGDNALIGGMIAMGTAGKRVIIRAIGPSLIPFGIPGALANPTLDLFQGSTLLFSNDDWNNSTQQAEIAASGLAPSNTLESAIIWTLTPGQTYTAAVRGNNGTTGIGVVEAFDLDPAAASKLGNISTRGFVDVDDNVMIAGLIAGPSNGSSLKILVRALGPTLTDFGVAGALANPTLDLVNASGTVIRSNNDWKDDPQQRAAIEAAGLGPSHDEEAALVETVPPGAYTAVVRGNNRATGVGLVESYNIP